MAMNPTPATSPKPLWKRWLRRLFLFAVLPYCGVAALLAIFQRSLIYVPTRAVALPASQGALVTAAAESVTVTTDDGLELHGWWLTSKPPPKGRSREAGGEWVTGKPVVLYFCGNAGHRAYRVEEFQILTSQGADVLCCDYRGYGENPGSPSEEGLAADARAVWNLATRDRGISPGRIVLFGESLGGGVAVRLAAEVCAAGTPPGGLIVRSTFSSLADVAASAIPLLPARWLVLDRFPSAERIPFVTCPILLVHGRRDTIVPFALGKKLFAAAPERSSSGVEKRLIELPTADHNDVLETEGRAFREAVEEFLEEVRGQASGVSADPKTQNLKPGT